MRRLSHFLTDQQIAALRHISLESGLPVAELVRRAVDGFIRKHDVPIPQPRRVEKRRSP